MEELKKYAKLLRESFFGNVVGIKKIEELPNPKVVDNKVLTKDGNVLITYKLLKTADTILELAEVGDLIQVITKDQNYMERIDSLIGYEYSKTFKGMGLRKNDNCWYFTYSDDVLNVYLWIKQDNDTYKRYEVQHEND